MMTPDPADLLEQMLAIPSPSGQEGELALCLTEWAGKHGFAASVDSVGNFTAKIGPGGGPSLMLLSHIDTAGVMLPATRHEGVLRGRGAVDAKGPLAAMLAAAASMSRFPGVITVVGAVQEEVSTSAGARHVLETQAMPDAVIVGEPNGWAGVGVGYRGRIGIEFEVQRPAVHSAAPGEKALEVAVEAWTAVSNWCAAQPGDTIFTRPSATLLHAEGDLETARMTIACRLPPDFDDAPLRALLTDLSSSVQVAVTESTVGVRCDPRNLVVRSLNAAIRDEGGRPRHKLKTGTCDLNVLAPRWPVPMAVYGPGNSKLDHTNDEHLLEDELRRATRVLSAACRSVLAELDAKGRPDECQPR